MIIPVGYVSYEYPKYKRREVNKYVRKYSDIENCISFDVMKYMMENAHLYPTLEMADNALSRYIAQKGKCAVTHTALSVSAMVCAGGGEHEHAVLRAVLLAHVQQHGGLDDFLGQVVDDVGLIPEDLEIRGGGLHLCKALDGLIAVSVAIGVGVLRHAPDALDEQYVTERRNVT